MSHSTEQTNKGFTMEVVDYLGDIARFGFNVESGQGGPGADNLPGFGVRTMTENGSGPVVRIAGQDLTALRDAILSLPDEAFPPIPKPPYVSVHGWAEGDIVHYPGGATYVRDNEGAWFSTWTQDVGSEPATDESIDKMLTQPRTADSGPRHQVLRQGGRFV